MPAVLYSKISPKMILPLANQKEKQFEKKGTAGLKIVFCSSSHSHFIFFYMIHEWEKWMLIDATDAKSK